MKTPFIRFLAWTCAFHFSILGHGFVNGFVSRPKRPAMIQNVALPGLHASVKVIRDAESVPHVLAENDHDAYFMMGYVHAGDRFFQMDVSRRQAGGTLAELFGPAALEDDFELRTLGFRRAAEESLPVYSTETRAVLQAYADGVNAWLADATQPTPSEYRALELTKAKIPTWTPLDSLSILKAIAFNISADAVRDLDFTTALAAYQQAGRAGNFDGTKLFFEDTWRAAPFVALATVPDFLGRSESARLADAPDFEVAARRLSETIRPETLELAAGYVRKIRSRDRLRALLDGTFRAKGSNWWVVSGSRTTTGAAMLANDPHLNLTAPPVWHEIHLLSNDPQRGPMNVSGVSFAGIPGVIGGANERICWGLTTNPLDVTDFFQEEVFLDKSTGAPKFTQHAGKKEPVTVIPQTYRANRIGDGASDNLAEQTVPPEARATFVVPRRNRGPLVALTPTTKKKTTGLSIQSTGFRATRDLEAFLIWSRARDLETFKRGVQSLDAISQNVAYADVDGNIAYLVAGEVPVREDLQKLGRADGTPPFLIRDGSGRFKNEWLPVQTPPPDQSLGFEILPFEEMPRAVNPASGYLANTNQDPVGATFDNDPINQNRRGGGIYYLNYDYTDGNRQARIVKLLETRLAAGGKVSLDDLRAFQNDNRMFDAETLTPYILTAMRNAQADGAQTLLTDFAKDKQLVEAVERLSRWDFGAPTGIRDGFDPGDDPSALVAPSDPEIQSSAAATIYGLWRSQMYRDTIDATLARRQLGEFLPFGFNALAPLGRLLETFPTAKGRGASGVNFFEVPGVSVPETARDVVILTALRRALDLAAGDAFAPAFSNSKNLADYRWGKLHRVVFEHPMGGAFNIPPAGGFTNLGAGLPGISKAGGYEVLDASTHDLRITSPRSCMFSSGPSRRFVAEASTATGMTAFQILPGGQGGGSESPLYANQLRRWLTGGYHQVWITAGDVESNAVGVTTFVPSSR